MAIRLSVASFTKRVNTARNRVFGMNQDNTMHGPPLRDGDLYPEIVTHPIQRVKRLITLLKEGYITR